MKRHRKLALLLGFIAALCLCQIGGVALALPTLISVDTSDPSSVGSFTVDASDVLAVSWYLPSTFYSVVVSVPFESPFGGGTFSAYLMDGIGPEATAVGNEIASTTFTTAASTGLSNIMLWQSLVLGPGQYYLVIGSTDPNSLGGGWGSTMSPVVTLFPGVTQGDVSGLQFFASGLDVAAYLPASSFAIDTDVPYGQLMYNVALPEAGSPLLFLGIGLAGLAIMLRGKVQNPLI